MSASTSPSRPGGLQALQAAVKYYQGGGYESEFSMSWGVGSAPTLFVVDRRGRLRAAINDHTLLEHRVDALLTE